jgi:hypothetical protein
MVWKQDIPFDYLNRNICTDIGFILGKTRNCGYYSLRKYTTRILRRLMSLRRTGRASAGFATGRRELCLSRASALRGLT